MAGFLTALAAAAAMAQAEPAASTATAPSAPAAATAAAAKAEKPKVEKICVEEVATGSHFRRKVCATREEWARRRAKDQETMTDTGGSPMR